MSNEEPDLSEFWGIDYMYDVVHKYEPAQANETFGKRINSLFAGKDKDDVVIKPAIVEDVPMSHFQAYNAKIANVW